MSKSRSKGERGKVVLSNRREERRQAAERKHQALKPAPKPPGVPPRGGEYGR